MKRKKNLKNKDCQPLTNGSEHAGLLPLVVRKVQRVASPDVSRSTSGGWLVKKVGVNLPAAGRLIGDRLENCYCSCRQTVGDNIVIPRDSNLVFMVFSDI